MSSSAVAGHWRRYRPGARGQRGGQCPVSVLREPRHLHRNRGSGTFTGCVAEATPPTSDSRDRRRLSFEFHQHLLGQSQVSKKVSVFPISEMDTLDLIQKDVKRYGCVVWSRLKHCGKAQRIHFLWHRCVAPGCQAPATAQYKELVIAEN